MQRWHNLLSHPIGSILLLACLLLPLVILGLWESSSYVPVVAAFVGILLVTLLLTRPWLGLLGLIAVRTSIDAAGGTVLSLGGMNFNIAALLSILVIVWGAWLLVQRRVAFWRLPLFWPMAAFAGLSAASALYSLTPSLTVEEVVRILSFFSLFLSAFTLITDRQTYRYFLMAVGASLVVPLLTGFYQVASGTGLTFADSVNRAYGTFGHPNVFAFYLVLAFIMLLGVLLASPRLRPQLPLAGMVIIATALLLTGTRGAWIGLAVAIAVIGLLRYRVQLILGVTLAVIGLAFLPIVADVTSRILGSASSVSIVDTTLDRLTNRQSYEWRIDLWEDMSRKVAERPLFGAGLGSFGELRQVQVSGFFESLEAHNDYLRLLVELGILGTASYLFLLGTALVYLFRAVRRAAGDSWSTFPLVLFGYLCGLLIMSFFDNLLQHTPVMWTLYATLGATLGTLRSRPSGK